MHRTWIVTVIAAFILSCTPAAEAGAPRLELDPRWFAIVDPYRYDEARRFEQGWNRGADAMIGDGVVRSPVGGRVRFAGDVAGRSVVTVDSLVDGVPVVVTLTGWWLPEVGDGAWIRRGAVLGAGSRVQVGMYDQTRRSRYLPVVTSDRELPGIDRRSVDRSTLSGSIARRLQDAILARALDGGASRAALVAPRGVHGAGALPMRTTVFRPAGSTAAPPGETMPHGWVTDTEVARPVVQSRAPHLRSVGSHRGGARGAVVLRVAATVAAGGKPSPGVIRPGDTNLAGGAVRDVDADMTAEEAGTPGDPAVGGIRAPRVPTHVRSERRREGDESATHRTRGSAGPEVVAVSTPGDVPGVDEDAVVERVGASPTTLGRQALSPTDGDGRRSWWGLMIVGPAVMAVLLLCRTRRRGASVRAPTRVHQPLTLLVPAPRGTRGCVVETDGSTVIPRSDRRGDARALAWADTEAGTSHGTDPTILARDRPRAPEHA